MGERNLRDIDPRDLAVGTSPRMEMREFEAVRGIVYRLTGISLSDAKRTLAESRLARRLRQHGFDSYRQYVQYLEGRPETDDEYRELINCITTNKTSFFREKHHFEFLASEVLPATRTGTLHIWSAGCSTGEEPYTIAMTARDHAPAGGAGRVRIFASDIDTQVLATAQAGVYGSDRLEGLDEGQLKRHFLRGTGSSQGLVRVRPELRQLIDFQQVNLIKGEWRLPATFDVIFCRNVIIYFDKATQERLLERFALALKPGGYLILGHSETIHSKSTLFEPLKQTVYRFRSGAAPSAPAAEVEEPAVLAPPVTARPRAARTLQAAEVHEAHLPARRAHHLSSTDALGNERTVVRIEAGQVHASKQPIEIRTLLGSCVSACLYDPAARLGGMNHFMLPSSRDEDSASARYGVHAMELLINDIMKLGGSRQRLQAKVFGAASVIRMKRTGPEVGEMNADFVLRFLEAEGIPVVAKQLGGKSPLEVRMESDTGKVRVKALRSDLMNQIDAEERRRTLETVAIEKRSSESDVTLF